VTARTATGRGRPGARTNLRLAARVGDHSSPAGAVQSPFIAPRTTPAARTARIGRVVVQSCSANTVVSSGITLGRLGRLALVPKEARGACEVGDDRQDVHASGGDALEPARRTAEFAAKPQRRSIAKPCRRLQGTARPHCSKEQRACRRCGDPAQMHLLRSFARRPRS